MKRFFTKHPNFKKHIVIGALVGLLYVAIQHFSTAQYVVFGFARIISPLISTQEPVGGINIVLNYVGWGLGIVVAPILIGILLLVLRQKNAFKIAFLTVATSYLLYTLVELFRIRLEIIMLLILFVITIFAYLGALYTTRKISKAAIIWVIIIALGTIDIYGLPYLTSPIVKAVSKNNMQQELNTAVKSMDFKGYYPTYAPSGLALTPPKLAGYGHMSSYENEHIEFNVGKLDFLESKKLVNQDQVLNFKDNCDISRIYFSTSFRPSISQAEIDQSRDNLAVCKTIGTTDAGYPVYVEANKSQFIFYFMAIGDTNIVMQHDTLPKPRYPADFNGEVFKIFNSMKEINPSQYVY